MKPVQIVVSFVMKDLSHFVHLCGRKPELDGTFYTFKAAYSVTMNIFRKKYFLFKSFVKVE